MSARKYAALIIFIAGALFAAVSISASQKEPEVTKSLTLDNGLKVFLYERHTLPLLNCVFGVKVGSKDETDETNGLVHILEHYLLFRGTQDQSGTEITRNMRRHGAYFNAHTGRDLALFEITIPSEHKEFALTNLKDILFDLSLTQEALDEEKEVILEELNQLQDDPFRLASSLLYQNLFPNHPYQRPITGNRKIIENASIAQLESFHRRFFVPANSSLAVVGDFSLQELEEDIRRIFGGLENGDFAPLEYPKISPPDKSMDIKHQMDTNMAYLAIGMIAPDYNHPDQYSVDVLTEIFGRGINPMIYHPLLQKRISVNSVSMGYLALRYGGAITIFVSLEPKNLKRAKREITNYLKQARKLNYSSDDVFGEAQLYAMDFMESAKNRIRFKGEQAQERGLAVATSLVRFMLLNEIPDRGNYLDHIAEITSTDLRQAAGKYLSQKHYVVISIEPKKK